MIVEFQKAAVKLADDDVIEIELIRAAYDSFQHDQFEGTCILLNMIKKRGACLHISSVSKEYSWVSFKTTFDCPVRVVKVREALLEENAEMMIR